MRHTYRALGRLKTGQMNKTEEAYARHLDDQRSLGVILWFRFEGVKLRLAGNTFLTPDFFVMRHDGQLEVHEVKGFWTDDAKAKTKIAADQYPFAFFIIKAKAKKDGGGWSIEEV